MFQTAYKVSYTRNAYGDFVAGAETKLKCHFRHISEAVSGVSNETVQADALAWFEPNADINREDILKIEGTHWRVERLIKARKLRDLSVQFIKVELLKYGTIS